MLEQQRPSLNISHFFPLMVKTHIGKQLDRVFTNKRPHTVMKACSKNVTHEMCFICRKSISGYTHLQGGVPVAVVLFAANPSVDTLRLG